MSKQSCGARSVSLAEAAEVSDAGVDSQERPGQCGHTCCLDTLVVADDNLVCWSIPKEMLRNGEYIAVYNISL